MTMMNNNEKINVDLKKVSIITKKSVRIERENYIQKEKNDNQMVEILKKIIETEASK